MSGIAIWNPGIFLGRYPEFTNSYNSNQSKFASYFVESGLYLSNSSNSPVQDVDIRLLLLNMLVAHISFLGGDLSADGQVRPVGRLSQAGEGSVSASFEWNQLTPGSGPWFNQTQYGAAFWQATSNLRGMQYSARRTNVTRINLGRLGIF